MALNGVHWTSSSGQAEDLGYHSGKILVAHDGQRLPHTSERMPHCQAFEGEAPQAPLCPIRAYAPLELVHLDYTSIESTMELNKPPVVKNILVITDHFMRYALVVVTKDQTAKTVTKVFCECFIVVFGVPTKLLSDRGANFTSALVEEPCAAFGIQKC